MSKKTKRRMKNMLCMIIMLLAGALAAIYGFSAQNAKKEVESISQEKKNLQETVEKLEQENAELKAQLEVLKNENLQSNEQEETQRTVDMRNSEPGAIIQVDLVDFDELQQYFCAYEIVEGDDIYQRIIGKSYRENNNIGLDDLVYLKILHYNFDHEIQMGELIVNAAIKEDYLNIFRELFEAEYEIQSMFLIDNYWTGDGGTSDSASIDENNTSAFCYREITGGSNLSNHAFGRAIDINPQQNPYVSYRSGYPVWSHDNADDYIDRDTGYEHVITHDDICYQIFTKYGFSWGGDWSTIKDYQHFEKE